MVHDNYKLQESIAAIIGEGMESEDLEKVTKQRPFEWLDKAIEIAIVALAGISTTIYGSSLTTSEIVLAWAFAIIGIISVSYAKLWSSHKKLLSDDADKKWIKEIFLKKIIEPKTVYGNDILIASEGKNQATLTFDSSNIEILAFSQKKFDFIMFTEENYVKYKKLDEEYGDATIGAEILRANGIDWLMLSDHNSFIKCYIRIVPKEVYVFYFARPEEVDKKDYEINITISDIT